MSEVSGYDDIVTFGRVLGETLFLGGDEPVKSLLDYFQAPHKWERERLKWLEFGGTFDTDCLDAFENWYDSKDINFDDD